MYGTPAIPDDLNLPFVLPSYKQGKEDAADLPQQQQQVGPGELLRYRSAPVQGDVCEELLPARGSEPVFGRFAAAPDPRDYLGGEKHVSSAPQPPHMFFQWHQQQVEHDQQQQQQQLLPGLGGGDGSSSSLLRHGSSPAGLVAGLSVDNGFPATRGIGSGGLSFGSRQGSLMSQISEESPDDGGGGGGARRFLSGYPVASWDDSAVLSDSFGKRVRDPSEVQNGEIRSHHQHEHQQQHMPSLTHHLDLPKSTADMATMERFFQLQDAVPCKVRAKRGCATHPRSIAERVRRTRISERIKKLQDLVPNMDKQTNTADMLDLAVDYIKDLQRHTKVLSDGRANCTCSSRHKP